MKTTQRQRLKQFFKFYRNQVVGVNQILDIRPRIAQYTRVISELRKIEKMNIKQWDDWVDGENRSKYMYVPFNFNLLEKYEKNLFEMQ